MMTIARKQNHHFYSVFLINEHSYNDIRWRLAQKELLTKHLMEDDDGREILVFGTTAFKKEY